MIRPRPPARVLTALPVYNEVRHLPEILPEVRRFAEDVLVIDDGSSDGTAEVLTDLSARDPHLLTVTHPENAGYGAALRTAFEFAIENNYDVLITIDCDGQHEPRLIPEMVAEIDRTGADLVSGSRYLKAFDGDSLPPEDRRRINVEITRQLNTDYDLAITDAFCGFKAYRVDTLGGFSITELGYAMPLQFWIQAVCRDLKIVEFPVPLIYLEEERSFGGSLDDARRRMAYYQEVLTREKARLADCLAVSG